MDLHSLGVAGVDMTFVPVLGTLKIKVRRELGGDSAGDQVGRVSGRC